MQISNRDLVKLAIMLSKSVHSLDFPKDGKFDSYASKTLQLVANLQAKYPSADLLRQIRQAIQAAPQDKMPLYTVSRDVLATVNRTVRFQEMTRPAVGSETIFARFFDPAPAQQATAG